MKGIKNASRKVISAILAAAMVAGMATGFAPSQVQAGGALTGVTGATANDNIVTVNFNDGIKGKITFLEGDIFRYNVDPTGVFSEYATTVYNNQTVRIPQYPDSYDAYSHPEAAVSEEDGYVVITAGDTTIKFEKATAKMTVAYKDEVVMEESEALVLGASTTQTLVKNDDEDFFGGGTQNGRFIHTGESINIKNESNWVDGGVASPNPFYYSTGGYGVLRNTFLPGVYDFGKTAEDKVTAYHNENEFDAYYFLADGENDAEMVQQLLDGYYHVTGNPVLLPEYAFYEGHLNAYNRDSWSETGSRPWTIYGSNSYTGSEGSLTAYQEAGQSTGYRIPENGHAESLNGTGPTVSAENFPESADTPYEYSARAVIDQYVEMDMPLGYFLPNDGYGAGYGQNGYYKTGGVNADGSSSAERTAAVDANVANLAEFTEYARSKGVEVGLWTQSYLVPDSNSSTYWHLLRDFSKEVNVGGVTTLKTDVAWVGPGYDMALNAQQTGYNTVSADVNYRPNLISLDGWAGTQRFSGIWTGDQYGGNWEYIRFHVPTYIGQSLSGNPNIGSDMDGIFGGDKIISTRDTQWKIFTPTMLNMDGWGSYAKTPQTFGDPYTGINRMYLKLKAQLMPYIYTNAAAAANLDTGNDDAGLPMIRAMFLEFPEDEYAATKDMQYQYMFGESILVAPVYTETENIDALGNDVRNGIYLPSGEEVDEAAAVSTLAAGEDVTEVFSDVYSDWYVSYVQYVYDNALMTGIKGTTQFQPNANITKAQVAQVLYNMEGQPAVDDMAVFTELNDVYAAEWYANAVAWAFNTGVVTGDLNTKQFNPNANVTREQLALMMFRYAKYIGKDVSAEDDLAGLVNAENVSNWAAEGVKWAVGAGLISGVEKDGVKDLAPQGNATRAQMAAILQRFCETTAEAAAEELIWIDYFTGDQYYGGQVLNNYDAPIWKLPFFVKNGAIIPMWEENNNPASIDRANRIAEFWPAGSTEYTLYEDEGTYVNNEQTEVDGYGTVNDIDYGDHVSTRYTSVVSGTTATLTAEKSTGTYEGYSKDKNTAFIVNVSKEPTAVVAKNGTTTLTMVEKTSKEEVLNAELAAGEFAYYYDEAPAIETYAVEGEDEFAAMMEGQVSSPKLYVKFAETDSQANDQTLVIKGFENVDEDLPVNKADETLAAPANLRDVEDAKTPTSNTIAWDAVEGATGYDVLVDGVLNSVGTDTTFIHGDQDYNSEHTYAVRARSANGYSEWTEVLTATTLLDPWRNVPKATRIIWNGGDSWGALSNATDHDTTTMFHSTGDVVTTNEPFVFDFGTIYELDKFEYYPRDGYSNGTVSKMDIYTSLDGVHWNKVHDGNTDVWTYKAATYEENVKTVDLTGNAARYIWLDVNASVGNFFSANELAVYKVDGSSAFAIGSTNLQASVTDGDYTNMNNYRGTSEKDGSDFVDQIQKRYGDINYNGVYDVYDYAFTAFPQDGGTTKTGSVSGSAHYEVTQEGENLVINVVADNVAKLNAFGQVLSYDPEKLEFVSVTGSDMVADMTDFNVNKVYSDGTAYVNLAFFNKGDQALVNGSGVLATIVMKGTDADAIDLSTLMLIGPDYSLITVETNAEPPAPTPEVTKYTQSDVTMTMTNSVLTTDDGSNVGKIIQTGSYDGLFNGSQGRDFELVWNVESNWVDGALPAEVSIPVTLTATFAEASPVTEVIVYNANKANGYATKAEAVLNYSDGTTSEKIEIELADLTDYAAFNFEWADNGKLVSSVDVTILSAISASGEEVTNMLTLAEMELLYTKPVETE